MEFKQLLKEHPEYNDYAVYEMHASGIAPNPKRGFTLSEDVACKNTLAGGVFTLTVVGIDHEDRALYACYGVMEHNVIEKLTRAQIAERLGVYDFEIIGE